LREAVHLVKYAGESDRASHLAALVEPTIRDLNVEALTPVPLHPNRLRERGFNQAELIAEALSRSKGVPVWKAIARVRDTPHQVVLGREERARNVVGAFTWREDLPLRPARVTLVDDVFTTGATLGACAAVLRDAGVVHVDAVTVC
jgi:ComF family protein